VKTIQVIAVTGDPRFMFNPKDEAASPYETQLLTYKLRGVKTHRILIWFLVQCL